MAKHLMDTQIEGQRAKERMSAYGRREDDWTSVQLMRVRDVAIVLGVSERFVQDHCQAGHIAHVRMGRRVMIPRAVVEQLAREGLRGSGV